MGSFLSVSQGSAEHPVFLEMTYNNAVQGTDPIVFVGKARWDKIPNILA